MTPRAFTLRYPAPTAPVWTPASLAGAVVLIDTSTATITQSGGRVSQINDQSGAGNHLTQSTSGKQPLTGSHTLNSKNVVYFNRTRNDSMITVGSLGLSQPLTIFTVWNALDTAVQRLVDSFSGARSLLNPSSGFYGLYSGTSVNGSAFSMGAVCQMTLHNGASSKLQINSTLTTGLNVGTNGLGQLLVGDGNSGGAPSELDLAHIAICSGDQSADFTNYQTWAHSTWATP